MAATQEQIDQQQRIILQAKQRVEQVLNDVGALHQSLTTYNQIGLSDDQMLADASFVGTGTARAQFRAAITSIGALEALLAAGHGTNLETFAR